MRTQMDGRDTYPDFRLRSWQKPDDEFRARYFISESHLSCDVSETLMQTNGLSGKFQAISFSSELVCLSPEISGGF